MKAGNFLYDSTMSALYNATPYWPYTLDHSMPHKCHGNLQKCPTRSFPGIWSMVMNEFDGSGILNINERSPLSSSCAMVDSCNIYDAEQFYSIVLPMADRNLFSAMKQEKWYSEPCRCP